MLDVSNKIALAMKENKQSAQMVKLGEKQIEQITEKMDQFKNENMKFKAGMKEKFYAMDVNIPESYYNFALASFQRVQDRLRHRNAPDQAKDGRAAVHAAVVVR